MKIKVLGLIVIIVLGFLLGRHFLRSEISVEYIYDNDKVNLTQDLDIIGDKIYFKNFKSLIGDGGLFLDNKFIFLAKDNKDKVKRFVINFQNFSVEKFDVPEKISEDSKIIFIGENDYLVINNGILRITNNEKKIICKNISYDKKSLYKISADLSKLIYYNSEKSALYTYHIPKKLFKRINYNLTKEILDDFEKYFYISPDGGYIATNEKNEDDVSISILGADSSKKYGDRIIGVNPIWINQSEKAAYLYNVKGGQDNNNYKIGVFDIPKRKIDYINYSDDESVYPYIWNGEAGEILYFTGKESEDKFIIDSIIKYDLNKKEKTRYMRNYSVDSSNNDIEIHKKDGKIIVRYPMEDGSYSCDLINANTGSEMNIKKVEGLFDIPYMEFGKGYIVSADNTLSYYDGESTRVVYRVTGDLERIFSEGENFAVAEKIGEGSQLVFMKIN